MQGQVSRVAGTTVARWRLVVGVLDILSGLYDVIVVATGFAPVEVLMATPPMLFSGIISLGRLRQTR